MVDEATKVSAPSCSVPLNGVERTGASGVPLRVEASVVKLVILTNGGSCIATLDSSAVRSGSPSGPPGVFFFEKKNHDAAPERSTTAAAAAISRGAFDDAGVDVAGVTAPRGVDASVGITGACTGTGAGRVSARDPAPVSAGRGCGIACLPLAIAGAGGAVGADEGPGAASVRDGGAVVIFSGAADPAPSGVFATVGGTLAGTDVLELDALDGVAGGFCEVGAAVGAGPIGVFAGGLTTALTAGACVSAEGVTTGATVGIG